jgi:large subunit ribosomal protein L14
LNAGSRKYAHVGDTIVGVVKSVTPNMPIKKSDIVQAVIVRTKKMINRSTGNGIAFDDNAVVVVNKEGIPRGTRIFGPVARELRDSKFIKIISLASEVL